ncbi:MAG TPA: hypothetical protein VLW49_01425 [Gaiellaceae bacterium]|nr:hypothetical protein [Gaiellaceae bacterium]
MRAPVAALVSAGLLLAGCGGSGKPSTTAAANGEASKPAAQVLADAEEAATSASSMHVSGHIVLGHTPLTLDLSIARGRGATGTMSTNGLSFSLVRIGKTIYVRGSDAFYKHYAGAALAGLLHGKWLQASATHGQLAAVAPITSAAALFAEVSSHHGKLANDGVTTYQGQQAVEIRDTSDDSKLYVSATGTPYPVALVGGRSGQSGAIAFDRWNAPVSVNAPKGALDISQLGG